MESGFRRTNQDLRCILNSYRIPRTFSNTTSSNICTNIIMITAKLAWLFQLTLAPPICLLIVHYSVLSCTLTTSLGKTSNQIQSFLFLINIMINLGISNTQFNQKRKRYNSVVMKKC